jgi:hypothetical protein
MFKKRVIECRKKLFNMKKGNNCKELSECFTRVVSKMGRQIFIENLPSRFQSTLII